MAQEFVMAKQRQRGNREAQETESDQAGRRSDPSLVFGGQAYADQTAEEVSLKHIPEKLIDFSDQYMRQNNEIAEHVRLCDLRTRLRNRFADLWFKQSAMRFA